MTLVTSGSGNTVLVATACSAIGMALLALSRHWFGDALAMLVFGIGAMAAGFAGIINAPIISITPNVGDDILIQCFVVVVVGGVGSFPGAIVGGIVAGEIMSLTSMFNPQLSQVMLYAVMTLVLVTRPQGLFGTR